MKLTEIKKGQVGTGLLVENDGFVSIDYGQNKVIKESLDSNNGDLNVLPRPFVLSALFQRYGAENHNGRVYPEHILKREVEKYQQVIRERRAYAECNHPDSSSIDVERIAINVVELHWEGCNLVGKIEIPITEGFRKYGIVSTLADLCAQWIISGLKIGLSSRGLGSVKQMYGKLIVDDDFELVCFDVVSQPSTNNAWIVNDESELQQYMESKETNKPVVNEGKLSEKFGKFKEWLND